MASERVFHFSSKFYLDGVLAPYVDRWLQDLNAIAEFTTLPKILMANGYLTALIGKDHE